MKTLLITIDYLPSFGGVATYYANTVKYWPEKDKIHVLAQAYKASDFPDFFDNKNVIRRKLIDNRLPILKWLPSFWHIWRQIRKGGFDNIIVGQVLPVGTVVWLLSKISKIKYSVFIHGMDFDFALKSGRKTMLMKAILKGAHTVICSNGFVEKRLNQIANIKNTNVVHPGIETEVEIDNSLVQDLRQRLDLEGKTVLYTVSRLVRRKGQDMVIKSLPEALLSVPDLVYLLVGRGPDEAYFRSLSEQSLAKDKIVFLEADDREKWALMELADIFIMPSRNIAGDFEGFGIVYLEANLLGKPVIAGDSGGVREAVVDGLNGLVVDPESESAIANAIIELASDPDLRNKLGNQGKIRAEKEFSWPGLVQKIYTVIN